MRAGSLMFLSCAGALDREVLANHGLVRPIYFGRMGAEGVASMMASDTVRALDHF